MSDYWVNRYKISDPDALKYLKANGGGSYDDTELRNRITQVEDNIGDLADLATSARDTATAASQTATQARDTATAASQTATQASQTATQASQTATQAKETARDAKAQADAARDDIGDISALETSDITDLVSAINELVHRISALES